MVKSVVRPMGYRDMILVSALNQGGPFGVRNGSGSNGRDKGARPKPDPLTVPPKATWVMIQFVYRCRTCNIPQKPFTEIVRLIR